VPPSIVTKIESGKFVEMADLVPSHPDFEDKVGAKSKQRAVTNTTEWLEAFAIKVSVVARNQPQCVPDLMGYQILMLEASSEYQNNHWMAYDRRFRQQQLPTPAASGLPLNPLFGILLSKAKPKQVAASTASACSICPRIVSLLLIQHMIHQHPRLQAVKD